MAESIWNLLEQYAARRGAPGECLTARQLLGMGQPSAAERRDLLARHILDCADCATRWNLIQSDAHVDLAELFVLERLNEEHFTKLRARQHLSHCRPCRRNEEALDNMILVENPRSPHYSNLVTSLRQGPAPVVTRRPGEIETLPAVVLRADGEPDVLHNEIRRVELPIQRAQLSEVGELTIELQAPPDCSQVQLAISLEGNSVMLPMAAPQQDVVRFIAETRLQGQPRKLASTQLAAWATRA